jgi:NTP pyrophosphatase (non-canonical NTP hydrolase)
MQIESAVNLIVQELERAQRNHDSFKNIHDGFGVITEEYFELAYEMRSDNTQTITDEVIQLGAMCLRFLTDLYFKPHELSQPKRSTTSPFDSNLPKQF